MQYKMWVHFEVQSIENKGTDNQRLVAHTAGWRVLTVDKLPECDEDFGALQVQVRKTLVERNALPSRGKVIIDNWKVLGHVIEEEELP